MAPVTRSQEILSEIGGLFFIEQDVIDLAAMFYSELRASAAAFGEESIEQLIPHVTSLFNKLNDVSRSHSELKQEVETLQDSLATAEARCLNLNVSFKDKSVACCELEDQYDADINNLSNLLDKCRAENSSLKERLDHSPVQTDRLVLESQERITLLTAERRSLLTTVEVLEADIKCLRAQLRKAESLAKQRRSSYGDDLMTELHAAEETTLLTTAHHQITLSQTPHTPSSQSVVNPPPPRPASAPQAPSAEASMDLKSALLIGDSHVRHASKECADRGAFVECLPGGKILDVKNRLLGYVGVSLDAIYVHVGCNNLRRGYRGGPGYNGGHGKREALHAMADLLYAAKRSFPEAKIFLSSVLVRRDISYKALHSFNTQLELMCNNFSVEFVEANSCVRRRDLSRDGVHFSRGAVSRLGSLFVNALTAALKPQSVQGTSLDPDPGSVDNSDNVSLVDTDVPQVAGN